MPKCFISYSWDSDVHKAWVLELARHLQRDPRITVTLDQWILAPGASLTRFMEEIHSADFCIVVSTPAYAKKANRRNAGAGYEAQIITSRILDGEKREKFIPIVRAGEFDKALPTFFKGHYAIDFRDNAQYAASFDQLIRAILKQPLHVPPSKGPLTNLSSAPQAAQPTTPHTPSPSKSPFVVSIISPRDLAHVDVYQEVRGKVERTDGQSNGGPISVVIWPELMNVAWAQAPVDVESDGSWKTTVKFGDEGQHQNQLFSFAAFFGPKRPLRDGELLKDWPDALASSDRIQVIRR